jgi:ribosomal protein L37AE/L43A
MGVLDDVIVNAKSAADAVGKKASKLVDISKLRISEANIRNDLAKQYESLGREVYEAQKAGSDFSAAVSSGSAAIDSLKEQLNAICEQLAAAREKMVCPECGHENEQGAVFCSKCGHSLTGNSSEQ